MLFSYVTEELLTQLYSHAIRGEFLFLLFGSIHKAENRAGWKVGSSRR